MVSELMATKLLIRAIIVDENDLQRGGLRSYLEAEADLVVVGDFQELSDAVGAVGELNPDVVLLSNSLPGVSLFTACQRIAAAVPDTRIIVLGSSPLDAAEAANALMAGASGFLPRDASRSDFVRVVRANGKGYMLHIPEVAARSLQFMRYNKRLIDADCLTNREQQVLILVSDGMKNAEIANELGISLHTVRNFIARIFAKLKTSNRADLGAYATLIGVLEYDATDKQ